jgi:hypothetical protein
MRMPSITRAITTSTMNGGIQGEDLADGLMQRKPAAILNASAILYFRVKRGCDKLNSRLGAATYAARHQEI